MLKNFKRAIVKRKYWIRQILVTSIAAAVAWFVGDKLISNGGLVAAIVCVLSIRVSLYKSIREGAGQIIGTAIGAGIALLAVTVFDSEFLVIGMTVLLSAVIARAIRLGEVASVNVPVTALIVIGPGISESTAFHRFSSTLIGAVVGIAFSYFSHPKTPAGRTSDQLRQVGKKAAQQLGLMAEGVAAGYSQSRAGDWLTEARQLVEEIPNLRSQSLEAKRYARWSPLQEADLADQLYLRAIALEHIVVQVRSVARSLFDLAVEGDVNSEPNRPIASAISSASYAVMENAQLDDDANFEVATVSIANDLRLTCRNLAAELLGERLDSSQESLIKQIELVSSLQRIADSIDESSPALSEVAMPDEPATAKVMVNPIEQTLNLKDRIWRSIRKFLRR